MKPHLKLFLLALALLPPSSPAQQGLAAQTWGQTIGETHRIHPKAHHLADLPLGPFANLPEGGLITVENSDASRHALISTDDAKTWQQIPLFAEPDKFTVSYERALFRTKEGTTIVSFMNSVERSGWNWNPAIHDSPEAKLPNYVIRSLDDGRTWLPPQKMHEDWTGAIRDMIQLNDGSVVFTSQKLLHNPGRHATLTYASKDQGATWTASNILDLGGIGHHDGAIEASLVQRNDHTLWMLIRTNWGKLWQAQSADGGLHWHPLGPTTLEAASAPPILERLASGRLFLAWNRYYYHGTAEYPKYGGDYQSTGAVTSNNRQELSIAFSEDDGKTWTAPEVIATVLPGADGKYPRKEVSYPYVFERRPGEIWLTAWRGAGLRVKLFEKDFVGGE